MNSDNLFRYERHLMLDDVGEIGQEKILNSKVLIVGIGGLGSPIAFYLAAAGVGTIGIADGDVVSVSNLQRQILHFNDDVDKLKTFSAKEKLERLNPEVEINLYSKFLDDTSFYEIIKEYDIVVDATDNFESKFMINDICINSGITFIHGGVLKFSGQVMTVVPGETACYRCVFGDVPDNPKKFSRAGILGSVAGILGSIQATEVLKVIVGINGTLKNRLLTFDAKSMQFRTIDLKRDNLCTACSHF